MDKDSGDIKGGLLAEVKIKQRSQNRSLAVPPLCRWGDRLLPILEPLPGAGTLQGIVSCGPNSFGSTS